MNEFNNKLKGILGDRFMSGKTAETAKFFRQGPVNDGLAVAYPETHEEVSGIVKSAAGAGVPVFTKYDRYLPCEISAKQGVIVDFAKMDKIERLDGKNLMAHVQCGVSFKDLQNALKKENLKVQTPAGITDDSVVKHFVNRAVIKSSARYPEPQITNMYVTLADGTLHKTGSHALDEMACDSQDGAAFLSTWYMGGRDVYGIVSRGSIVLYPIWEKRDVIVFDFADLKSMLTAMRDIPRREIGIEYLGMNPVYLKRLAGVKCGGWIFAAGFDGFAEHVDWQEKIVRRCAGEIGGKENQKAGEAILSKIDEVWPAMTPHSTSFLTLFARAPEFDDFIRKEAQKCKINIDDIGTLFISMDRGRSVYCLYEFYDDSDKMEKFIDDLNLKLLGEGAYFDTPQGGLSKAVFDSIEGYSAHLRRIKDMLDPRGILNPGILMF